MAITSELLGKLGGADVETIPVSATVKSKDPYILYIGEVLPGETHWVFVLGTVNARSSSSHNLPDIWIGDTSGRFSGEGGVATEVKAGYHVTIGRNFSGGEDSFDGHVYIVKG